MLGERFWSKVAVTPGCWLWTSSLTGNGYPQYLLHGRQCMAHRLAYEELVGPVPTEMELDHVRERGCTNRNCVNPAHLEVVTHVENCRRASNAQRDKTHCPRGHAYNEANTYRTKLGKRMCRQCGKERMQRHRALRKVA